MLIKVRHQALMEMRIGSALNLYLICAELIRLSPHHQKISLCGSRYSLIFRHLRSVWADQVNLVPETGNPDTGEIFVGVSIQSYTRIVVRGLPYGVARKHRGIKYCFAYIEGSYPVRIAYIFHIKHLRNDPSQRPLEHTCAVVQRFKTSHEIPVMPWDIR